MSDLERLVRYCHPEKILALTRLPGALDEAALAALYGVSVDELRALAARLRAEPIERFEGALALGDSHTDDLGSWAELLGVINAGISGDTTTHALARVVRLPPSDVAIVLLGTNDARRHGGGPMLVSHRETLRNLRAIEAALRRRVVWVTPPPVDERRIAADAELRDAGVAWRLEDVARKAALVRAEWPGAVDLWPAFGPDHLAPDGLHPSTAGQRLIAERVAAALAKCVR